MSKIDEQIKELQLKKTQIKELGILIESVSKMITTKDLQNTIVEFASNIKQSLEDGQGIPETNSEILTKEDIQLLKTLASKAARMQSSPKPQTPIPTKKPKASILDTMDAVRFVQTFNDRVGKEVRNLEGAVIGTLQAPAYPNLIILTKEGKRVEVEADSIMVSN